jgi:hypothetical protein
MFGLEAFPETVCIMSNFNKCNDLTLIYRVSLIAELNTAEQVMSLVSAVTCHVPYRQAAW